MRRPAVLGTNPYFLKSQHGVDCYSPIFAENQSMYTELARTMLPTMPLLLVEAPALVPLYKYFCRRPQDRLR